MITGVKEKVKNNVHSAAGFDLKMQSAYSDNCGCSWFESCELSHAVSQHLSYVFTLHNKASI